MTGPRRLTAKLGVVVEPDVYGRARAAVFHLRGTEHAIAGGLSGLVNTALQHELERLEQEHVGNGGHFPEAGYLPPGPAI